MIEQIKSSILKEATTLLKTQNNNYNDHYSVSFDKLFKTNNSDNSLDHKEYSDYTIEINADEKYTETDALEKNNAGYQQTVDKNNSEYHQKEAINNKNSEKKDVKVKKTDDKNKQEKIIEKKDFTNNKIDNNTFVIDDLKIVLKIKNIEQKFNLDFKTTEKIKKVLHDLKTGKINNDLANNYIQNIIRNTNIKGLSLLQNKHLTVRIKNSKNEKNNKLEIKNLLGKNTGKKENVNEIKVNNQLNKEQLFNSKSADKYSQKNTLSENVKLKVNDDKPEVKDFKSEIKLEISNNKIDDVVLNRNRINTKNVLEQNKQNLFKEIAKNTKIVLQQNQTKFSTMIRPENFGRIDFKFVVKDGKVNGRMVLQNQEVADFFRSNVEEIRAVFSKTNVELENIDIILAGNRFADSGGSGENNDTVRDNENNFSSNFSKHSIETFEENNVSGLKSLSKAEESYINVLI